MARDTVLDRFKGHAQKMKDKAALYWDDGGTWRPITWGSYWEQCVQFASALMGLGYKRGEAVAIMGNNCPQWVVADVGAMLAGGVPAGIYQTCTPDQAAYIVEHSEARVFVVEDAQMWRKLADVHDRLQLLDRVVLMKGASLDARVVSLEAFLKEGAEHRGLWERRFEEIEEGDLATLIYTSGTTGPPKGAMLSHKNLAWTAATASEIIGHIGPKDRIVSYLPLSHIAEQMFTIHGPLTGGAAVWFCEEMPRLKDVLLVARPTIFLGVPRVWEKFKAALEGKLKAATGVKASIVSWARGVGLQAGLKRFEVGDVGGWLGVQESLAVKLFSGKLKAALGLDALRVAIVGAAPIGRDVMEFFLSCGIAIQEVYGQSEGSGPTTFNRPQPGWTRFGTVGREIPGVKVKIAPEDGEILMSGPNVFMGYFKHPEATAETLIDGWLHTGDVGVFDDQGFLKITDRKKELIITAGGKNVAPQNIEKELRGIEGIGNAASIGDKRKFISALLTLDPIAAPELAKQRGWPTDLNQLAEHDGFLSWLDGQVKEANKRLSNVERVKQWKVLPEDFSVEGGELTPTQKLKRRVVESKYADIIEGFYNTAGSEGVE